MLAVKGNMILANIGINCILLDEERRKRAVVLGPFLLSRILKFCSLHEGS